MTVNADGTLHLHAGGELQRADSFTYTATDGTAAANVATVTITVTGVNDAPVAVDDAATTAEDTAVSGAVLGERHGPRRRDDADGERWSRRLRTAP